MAKKKIQKQGYEKALFIKRVVAFSFPAALMFYAVPGVSRCFQLLFHKFLSIF